MAVPSQNPSESLLEGTMTILKFLTLVSAALLLPAWSNDMAQEVHSQPSISFGTASISLGMTVEQVQSALSGSGMHLKYLTAGGAESSTRQSNPKTREETSIVYRNSDEDEGQITFSSGRVVYAQFQMPVVQSADEQKRVWLPTILLMDGRRVFADDIQLWLANL